MTLVCSLYYNNLDAEAAKYLSQGLAKNETLTSLKYAATHPFPCCQCLLTLSAPQNAKRPPRAKKTFFSECLCDHAHTYFAMPLVPVRRMDAGHELMSDG